MVNKEKKSAFEREVTVSVSDCAATRWRFPLTGARRGPSGRQGPRRGSGGTFSRFYHR